MKLIHTLLIIGTLLACGSGIASAGNVTLFDDEDTAWAQTAITDSGAGRIFALFDILVKYILIFAPLALVIMAILYRMMNNSEKYKNAIGGVILIIGVLLVLSLYFAIIEGLSPDISTVNI
jgi:uncharacterized membrane protein